MASSVAHSPAVYSNLNVPSALDITSYSVPLLRRMKQRSFINLRSHRKSAQWHQDVDRTAGCCTPIPTETSDMLAFPWSQLRQHTDDYLKTKSASSAQEKDIRLRALIFQHAKKEIAIAACAHAMSDEALSQLFLEDLPVPKDDHACLRQYLQAFVAASHAKPAVFTETDAHVAISLFQLTANRDTQHCTPLQAVLILWKTSAPKDTTLQVHLETLVRDAMGVMQAHLNEVKQHNQWNKAFSAAESISFFKGMIDDGHFNLQRCLDHTIPEWRHWAAWKANRRRVERWLSTDGFYSSGLKALLPLEGPDFDADDHQEAQPNLCQSLSIRNSLRRWLSSLGFLVGVETASVHPEYLQSVDKFLAIVDRACYTQPCAIVLLNHVKTCRRLDEGNMRSLEAAFDALSPTTSGLISRLFRLGTDSQDQTKAFLLQLLQHLKSSILEQLRYLVASRVAECCSESIVTTCDTLAMQVIAQGPWYEQASQFQLLREEIRKAEWLTPDLDKRTKDAVHHHLSSEDISCLCSMQASVRSRLGTMADTPFPTTVNTHIVNTLGLSQKPVKMSEQSSTLMKSMVVLWQSQFYSAHRELVLDLVELKSLVAKDVLYQCIIGIKQLPLEIVPNIKALLQSWKLGDPLDSLQILTSLVVCKEDSELMSEPFRCLIGKCAAACVTLVAANVAAAISDDSGQWFDSAIHLCVLAKANKDVSWLAQDAGSDTRGILETWPDQADVFCMHSLQAAVLKMQTKWIVNRTRLYLLSAMPTNLRHGSTESPDYLIVALVELWKQFPGDDVRGVALDMAGFQLIPVQKRCECLSDMTQLPSSYVLTLRDVFLTRELYGDEACQQCVIAAQILRNISFVSGASECWRAMLDQLMLQLRPILLNYAAKCLDVDAWFHWIDNIRVVLGPSDWPDLTSSDYGFRLEPALRGWIFRLQRYLRVIKSLETRSRHGSAVICILTNHKSEIILDILEILYRLVEEPIYEVLEALTIELEVSGCNAGLIHNALVLMPATSEHGASICKKFRQMAKEHSSEVAEWNLSLHLRDTSMHEKDRAALKSVGLIFGLFVNAAGIPRKETLHDTAERCTAKVSALLLRAGELEKRRIALMAHDPDGVASVLGAAGIATPSRLDDELAILPTRLVDVVERMGDQTVELHFPLSALNRIQMLAAGLAQAQSMVVRLRVSHGDRPAFCVHTRTSAEESTEDSHSPRLVSPQATAPLLKYCHGKVNRATFQLSRLVWRQLSAGPQSLETLYDIIATRLKSLGAICLVCGADQSVNVTRATVCNKPGCVILYRRSSLDLRLSDIRQHPAVVDLLLTSVHAVALSSNLDLLPERPFDLSDSGKLASLVNGLPRIVELQKSRNLDASLKSHGARSVLLFSYLFTQYRGYLIDATGDLRIPSMPGIHQFVLASAAPELEAAFSVHAASATGRVLFHGTSLDRLYAILCQGLRVCSGTSLQRNGAALGAGIYMAEEPSTAQGYASGTRSTQSGWSNSSFKNTTVMLGCEFVGASQPPSSGIHVITDPSRLMLRYIFLMPPGSHAPLAAHVVPAMLSAFSSLRPRPV